VTVAPVSLVLKTALGRRLQVAVSPEPLDNNIVRRVDTGAILIVTRPANWCVGRNAPLRFQVILLCVVHALFQIQCWWAGHRAPDDDPITLAA
jgi:hypothetical protein